MKLNIICIKFHQKIKTLKPKLFWTFEVFKVFFKNLKNLGFLKPFSSPGKGVLASESQ